MKLYGNLMNRIAESSTQKVVKVGDGATVVMYSDRKAATVVEATDMRIIVQEDTAKRTDSHGMSDSQSYMYERNAEGRVYAFTKRRNGRFVEQGQKMNQGVGLVTGVRDEYHDFGF